MATTLGSTAASVTFGLTAVGRYAGFGTAGCVAPVSSSGLVLVERLVGMPPTDTTADRAAMRLHNMLDNKMHLVRPVEVRDVIQAAQLVVTADDEYVADESDQYPHEVMVAVDLLRERLNKLSGGKE